MAAAARHWQADGCGTVSAMIFVDEAEEVMDFAQTVFGATAVSAPLRRQGGTLWHAVLKIGDSTIMLSAAALSAGAQPTTPVEDQFYGDRAGGVTDMTGNFWWISTQVETMDDAKLQKRAAAFERAGG